MGVVPHLIPDGRPRSRHRSSCRAPQRQAPLPAGSRPGRRIQVTRSLPILRRLGGQPASAGAIQGPTRRHRRVPQRTAGGRPPLRRHERIWRPRPRRSGQSGDEGVHACAGPHLPNAAIPTLITSRSTTCSTSSSPPEPSLSPWSKTHESSPSSAARHPVCRGSPPLLRSRPRRALATSRHQILLRFTLRPQSPIKPLEEKLLDNESQRPQRTGTRRARLGRQSRSRPDGLLGWTCCARIRHRRR